MQLKRRCKCGCGKQVTRPGNKWIYGHNTKRAGKSCNWYKHGWRYHKLYTVWINMKSRCYNVNSTHYENYGGRGIKVFIRWRHSPKAFCSWAMSHGWKEGLEIDRKNNDGNYHPDNCRFVTRSVNQKNTRPYQNNTSGYLGVHFNKKNKKYIAKLYIKGKSIYLGSFNTAEEAAQAIKEYKNA